MTNLTKPVSRIATVRPAAHGYGDRLVITLYPGGVIGLREVGTRREVRLDAGELYARALIAEARLVAVRSWTHWKEKKHA